MKINNKKLIIFDLDGTLINSALDLAISINEMLEKLGHKKFDETIIHNWVGNGAYTLVWRALSGTKEVDRSIDETEINEALDIFLEIYEKNLCIATKPYDDVLNTLEKLNENYILTIVTNKPFKFVTPILEKLHMNRLFKYILGGDSLEEKKPNPLPLKYICKKFDVKIESAVMVGDSKNDILAANACNMDSIGVTYGYNYGEHITLYKPTIVIDNFKDILKYL